MCTGRSSFRVPALFLSLLAIGFTGGSARAQGLKLRSLTVPREAQPGAWVSYQVKIESPSRPPRQYTQRLAVVSKEGLGDESGVWVELKSIEAGKTRIERGFFASGGESSGQESERSGQGGGPLRLMRYQVLTPEGKLIEYPMGSEWGSRADVDISAMDALEFMPAQPPDNEAIGADTLRVGRKVVPCRVERVRRYGAEDWSDEDTLYVNRVVMAQTFWRNPAIPVTGYARSLLEVTAERVQASGGASGAPAGETARTAAGDAGAAKGKPVYRADLSLLDLGTGAVPEVTQEPEPAPSGASAPRSIPR